MLKKPKIEINKAKNDEFFLTLKAANGKKVLTSGETYKTKQGVNNAVKAAKKIVKGAEVVDNTKTKRK
jgi:uncharacterized protein YegP (UPF0339 family)